MQSPPFPRYLVPPRSKYSPQHHVLKHPQLPFLPQCQRPSFTPTQNNRQNYSSIYLDLGILFWPKLQRCLFAAPVAQRFSLLYSGSLFMWFQSYTQRRTTVGTVSLDEGPARHRDLYLTTHTTLTTDKRPCPLWDSNPRSQQANGRRPTP